MRSTDHLAPRWLGIEILIVIPIIIQIIPITIPILIPITIIIPILIPIIIPIPILVPIIPTNNTNPIIVIIIIPIITIYLQHSNSDRQDSKLSVFFEILFYQTSTTNRQ